MQCIAGFSLSPSEGEQGRGRGVLGAARPPGRRLPANSAAVSEAFATIFPPAGHKTAMAYPVLSRP